MEDIRSPCKLLMNSFVYSLFKNILNTYVLGTLLATRNSTVIRHIPFSKRFIFYWERQLYKYIIRR